jgi:Rhodopirellula transposase DDE domain
VAPTATATGSGKASWRRWPPRQAWRPRCATHRPGTSKWNKIEHRLFSHITLNWRGRPLTSHEVVVKTIAATTTRSGLRVEAALDTGDYPTGVAISKERFDALPLQRHAAHSVWNYTLHPRPATTATQPEPVGEQDGPAEGSTGGSGARFSCLESHRPDHLTANATVPGRNRRQESACSHVKGSSSHPRISQTAQKMLLASPGQLYDTRRM